MMVSIKWCLKQKEGIELVEPNNILADKYKEESKNDLNELYNATSNKWKYIEAYYACYNSIYAIFQKIGIKSEIHDCTIKVFEFISPLLEIDKEDISYIKKLKKGRIDFQYYLKEPEEINIARVKDFILNCNLAFSKVDYDKIIFIRGEIEKMGEDKNETSGED